MKISNRTIARTIILIFVLVNQVLTSMGINPIDISDDTIYELCSLIATIGTSIWTWWKNNSFTKKAIAADEVLKK